MPINRDPRNQHDAYCKATLADPEVADEILRPFMDQEMLALIADGPPQRVPGNHVDEESRMGHMDLNFLYRRRDDGFLRLVLEHKSWCDPGTPAQLCRYTNLALAAPEHRDAEPLVTAVLYHGRDEWTAPFAIERSGDGSAPARQPVGAFCYPLWNLMKLDIEAQRFSPKPWIVVTAMVGAFRESVRAEQLDRLLLALPAEGDFTKQTLAYVSNAWDLDRDWLRDKLESLRANEGGEMMGNTVLDAQIEAEAKGKAELLLTLLRLKFSNLPEGAEGRVRSASAVQLDAWAAAILTATTLDELFATMPKR